MNNFVTSLIRTYTPVFVGAIIAYLATSGVNIDSETQTALIIAITGFSQAIYYTLARLLESKFPQVGILLGIKKNPDYK